MMDRAWRHCSDKSNCTKEVRLLHQRSIDVGHDPTNLATIFIEAAPKLQKQLKLEKTSTTKNITQKLLNHQRLFFHPTYHPRDAPRKNIQDVCSKTCAPMLRDLLDTKKIDYRTPLPKEYQRLVNAIKTKRVRRRKEQCRTPPVKHPLQCCTSSIYGD